ncbi:hypothetical protein RHECNPAF_430064 [Rhizobium etli CNPAF512]|nr:hypothetical protein RHECNPAF_430064 [Rhizobium etli CNPAF512]
MKKAHHVAEPVFHHERPPGRSISWRRLKSLADTPSIRS